MSGSGGGGGGGGSQPDSGNCATLVVRTFLNSPKPDVLATLEIGARLRVVLTPPRGPLEAKTAKGRVAGSITAADMVKLINCISKGHEYEAKVLSINGGRCEVEIRATK